MIYIDTSIVVAHLLAEARFPPEALWNEDLASSRLLEYELWNRLHARGLAKHYEDDAREVLQRISFYELSPIVLARALESFPEPVRTLDGLHLATLHHVQSRHPSVQLASYDEKLASCARHMRCELYPL